MPVTDTPTLTPTLTKKTRSLHGYGFFVLHILFDEIRGVNLQHLTDP
jgi:hypothetical protein